VAYHCARLHTSRPAFPVGWPQRHTRAELPSEARYFGTRLGGLKVRLAIMALRRVLQVAYAEGGFAGPEQGVARVQGHR
jgi:hypothetical protein